MPTGPDAPLWLPDAERVRHAAGGHHGGTLVGGPPRMVHHITWDKLTGAGQRPKFEAVRDYLVDRYDPTVLADPFTGRMAQYLPANVSAYALEHLGGVETNRMGSVCLQVEWFFSPGTVIDGRRYDRLTDTPMLGWSEIVAWGRAWGVPDRWPLGQPTGVSHRNAVVWAGQAGHYGHVHVPNNVHTDPPCPLPAFPPAGSPAAAPVLSEEDDMRKDLLIDDADNDNFFVVAADLGHKTRLSDPVEIVSLRATGLYEDAKLRDSTLARIPDAK